MCQVCESMACFFLLKIFFLFFQKELYWFLHGHLAIFKQKTIQFVLNDSLSQTFLSVLSDIHCHTFWTHQCNVFLGWSAPAALYNVGFTFECLLEGTVKQTTAEDEGTSFGKYISRINSWQWMSKAEPLPAVCPRRSSLPARTQARSRSCSRCWSCC